MLKECTKIGCCFLRVLLKFVYDIDALQWHLDSIGVANPMVSRMPITIKIGESRIIQEGEFLAMKPSLLYRYVGRYYMYCTMCIITNVRGVNTACYLHSWKSMCESARGL